MKAEAKIKCWKLKKDGCCTEFGEELRQAMSGREEFPENWECRAAAFRETAKKVFGASSGQPGSIGGSNDWGGGGEYPGYHTSAC